MSTINAGRWQLRVSGARDPVEHRNCTSNMTHLSRPLWLLMLTCAVCAGTSIRNEIEIAAQPKIGRNLRLIHLDLEPGLRWTGNETTSTSPQAVASAHQNTGPRILLPRSESRSGTATIGDRILATSQSRNHQIFVEQKIAEGRA